MPLFREILSPAARLEPVVLRRQPAVRRRFQRASSIDRLGLGGWCRDSQPALAPSVARGVQEAVQETVLALAGEGENLCLAGGLFFNALLVEFLESSGRWKNVFVQAAAGNAGTALGAVFHVWHQVRRNSRGPATGRCCWAPVIEPREIKQVLENCKLRFQYLRSTDEMLARRGGPAWRAQDPGVDAGPHGVRSARAGQPQHSGFAARSVLDREFEHLHQAPRAVPQIRGVGSGGAGVGVFRGGAERA